MPSIYQACQEGKLPIQKGWVRNKRVFRLLHSFSGSWLGFLQLEAHLHAKHEAHRVAALGGLLPAQRMDADRLLVTGLTILALLLWVPARLLGHLGLSWLPEAALQVKGKIVHCSSELASGKIMKV